jgi:hypothetical protein
MKLNMKSALILAGATALFLIATADFLHAEDEDDAALQAGAPAPAQSAPANPSDAAGSRMNRIDFGNTYIVGQSIKSGAVYLLQRKKSEIKSMLTYREDYRREILDGFEAGDGTGAQDAPKKPGTKPRAGSAKPVSRD